jgi:hypothetical protein
MVSQDERQGCVGLVRVEAHWSRVYDRQGLVTAKYQPEDSSPHLTLERWVRCVGLLVSFEEGG